MRIQILSFIILCFASISGLAQKSVPYVDSKGHIHNNKVQIGTLTTKGGVNKEGISMTQVDRSGNIVDSTGKIIGKAPKNGTFEFYMNDEEQKYSIGKPSHNGMCAVKNKDGETVLLLHQNYKAQAACAIHCLYANHCMPGGAEHAH